MIIIKYFWQIIKKSKNFIIINLYHIFSIHFSLSYLNTLFLLNSVLINKIEYKDISFNLKFYKIIKNNKK